MGVYLNMRHAKRLKKLERASYGERSVVLLRNLKRNPPEVTACGVTSAVIIGGPTLERLGFASDEAFCAAVERLQREKVDSVIGCRRHSPHSAGHGRRGHFRADFFAAL